MTIQHGWRTTALAAAAALTGASAMAQSAPAYAQARVLSATPLVQQVGVPQQYCQDEQVYSGQGGTGTGAAIGAVLGGVAGNAAGRSSPRRGHYGYGPHYRGGHSSNRGAATIVGVIAGGLLGHAIESSAAPGGYQTVRRCTEEVVYENRTVGYDVTYEYGGQRYATRMEQYPGQWIQIPVQGADARGTGIISQGSSTRFYGPSGQYQPAPAGATVVTSPTY